MPFIHVQTNTEIQDKESLKQALGQLITMIPGKTEERTMICLEEKLDLYFGGSGSPCAMVKTRVNLGSGHSRDTEYCDAVIGMLSEQLGIAENRIYTVLSEEGYWYCRR